MAICDKRNENSYYRRLTTLTIIFSLFILSSLRAGEREKPGLPIADSISAISQITTPQIESLLTSLKSGKPTVAFFYYSVACSCTAARCAIAAAAIDSIPELRGESDSLNFVRVDAYLEESAEKMYKVPIVPAIVFFDETGTEVNRLEWGTNVEAITTLIKHPEIKQRPVD